MGRLRKCGSSSDAGLRADRDDAAGCGGEPSLRCKRFTTGNWGKSFDSEPMYEAGVKIENRFFFAATAMRAARKLHVSSTRTEDTVNRVLAQVGKGQCVDWRLPEPAPPPAIDLLLITPAYIK